jgi:hypothetical protein
MFRGARSFSGAEGRHAADDAVEFAFSTMKCVMSVVRRPQNAEYLSIAHGIPQHRCDLPPSRPLRADFDGFPKVKPFGWIV